MVEASRVTSAIGMADIDDRAPGSGRAAARCRAGSRPCAPRRARPAARPSAAAAGSASSARPMATRCFSPPESRPGRRSSRPPMPSRSTTWSRSSRRSAARREPAAVEQVLPHGQMREQPPLLEHVADAAPVARHEDAARRCRPARRRRSSMRPWSGRISPAMTLTSEVLPAPERPNSAMSPPPVSKRASSRKFAEPVPDVDGQRHSTSRRRLARRASSSEASSASIEIATETSVRRSAPASPPGTCVKV